MLKTNEQKILAIVVGVFIVIVGWFGVRNFFERANSNALQIKVDTPQISEGGITLEDIPVNLDLNADTIARPSLARPITIPASFSSEARAILEENIKTLVRQLKENPDSFGSWAELAVQYKTINDVTGAVEIWEYLSLVVKDNIVVRINLGNAYHFDLKNFEQSEKIFNEVVAINNKTADAYFGLYELYRYSYKTDTTLAEDSLTKGIKALPQNTYLRLILGGYYADTGRTNDARRVYGEARGIAEAEGNTGVVQTIDAALSALQ